jgi:TatD DNase family protein
MFVDSHCHLSFPELAERIDDIRADMVAASVDRALCICTTLEEFDTVQGLAARFDNFWCSAGVHPDNEGVREPRIEDLVELAQRPRVVAIGETGLDYYRLNGRGLDDMEWQRERFRVHIRAGRATGLPLVVHTRSASADTLRLLREEGAEAVGGVFHCFTETMQVAREALDLGFSRLLLGHPDLQCGRGPAERWRAIVPLERCLIETDSPYLAPVPFRGRTNTPALVPYVARKLAELKGVAVEEVAVATSRNFESLFKTSLKT